MKLDNIDKRNVFKVPDGYFDKLPGIVQSRVAGQQDSPRWVFRPVLQYALPAVALLIAAWFWFVPSTPSKSLTSDEMLAGVETEALIAYLDVNEELELDDVLDFYQPSENDITELEQSLYGDEQVDDALLELLESEYEPGY